MTDTVLEFTDLYKDFDHTKVLKGITAQVHCGEVIGLLGLNGAGKTTLLETALGFTFPTTGSCKVFNHESATLKDKKIKARIGFVPQQDELLELLTGAKYLKLIASFYDHWNQGLMDRLSEEWKVPMDKKIQILSLGQRQKLSILSALGHEPDLLILDEPVASLDPVARRQFLKELVEISASQTRTIVFSTHIVSDIERIASRVWLIKDGHISIDESLDSLKERTVKIHLAPGIDIPENIKSNNLVHMSKEQNSTILVFNNWNDEEHKRLEKIIGCSISPHWLSLEDIFLEIHS